MDSHSSSPRSVTRWLFTAAILALPLAPPALVGCSGDADQSTTSTTGTSSTGSTGGGDGSCSSDDPCPSDAVCVLPANACAPGSKGTCQTHFQCDGPSTGPLCDCAGKIVEGDFPDCVPSRASESYGDSAPCQTGTFACGPTLMCKRNSDVCVTRLPGAPGPASYECASFESVNQWCQHGIPDCDCIDAAKVGDPTSNVTCKADAEHQETITVAAQ